MSRLDELRNQLADNAARSDVECYALPICDGDAVTFSTDALREHDQELVDIALEYLALRGDALPFRVIREGDTIRFEDK